jgi:3'(2'), 5'-bisphosphate nucleotidase
VPAASDLLDPVRDIADRAGAVVISHYHPGVAVRSKPDASPVTAADEAAERLIVAALRALTPDIPVVAEEEIAAGRAPALAGDRFWLVDPLDGTKEFLQRNGEFTVNIALVERGRPVLGVVFAPAMGRMFSAALPGKAYERDPDGARRAIAARKAPAAGVVLLASRSHGDPREVSRLAAGAKVAERRVVGSSIKFCLVACGEADLYPRYGATNEWDTAAGHAVLAAAGGSVRTLDGRDLAYGKPGFRNPEFIARGRES